MVITKEDVQKAFRTPKCRHRKLLFTYYKEWFLSPLTAKLLAQKISADLGTPINENLIYHTRQTCKPELINHLALDSIPPGNNHQPELTRQQQIQIQVPVIPDMEPISTTRILYLSPTK